MGIEAGDMMHDAYDVIVVGAATAGSYFGKLMAERGLKVLIVDKLSAATIGKRLDIFHVDKELLPVFGVPEPRPGDEDYVLEFQTGLTLSPNSQYPKKTDYPFLVLHMPLFIRRLNRWAESYGAEMAYDTQFVEFVYDGHGKIAGAALKKDGQIQQVAAQLVVDASGIVSDARTKLKDGYGVENFPIAAAEQFYVVLRYVKLKTPAQDRVTMPRGWPTYKAWIAPQHDPDGAIVGIGQPYSFEYAEQAFREFTANVKLPEYEVQYKEQGVTPYRRPPYSFVADGFLTIGDSACLTKPFSGEGVTAAWRLCKIAAETIAPLIARGRPLTRGNMWRVNMEYVHGQGAKFAFVMGWLVGAVSCTLDEQEFMFKKDIVFSDQSLTTTARHFEAKMSTAESLGLVLKMLGGVFVGQFRLSTIFNTLGLLSTAGKIKKHYERYPDTEAAFAEWCKKADALWSKAGSISDTCPAPRDK
jgi:digeranylgeranylglycerophospholipid reductase